MGRMSCTPNDDRGFAGKRHSLIMRFLAMPEKEGVIKISTSPILFGMTCPYPLAMLPAGIPIAGHRREVRRSRESAVIFKDRPDTDWHGIPSAARLRGSAGGLQRAVEDDAGLDHRREHRRALALVRAEGSDHPARTRVLDGESWRYDSRGTVATTAWARRRLHVFRPGHRRIQRGQRHHRPRRADQRRS